jgi:nicotinate-nucleotide adenylyltransferase
MTRAAVEGNPSFEVSEVELDRDGPSFTVDTLHHYRKHVPNATLFLLLGMDQVVEFQDWERPDEIQTMATLVALSRGGSDRTSRRFPANQDGSRFRFQYLDVTRIDVSATEIRRRVGAGRSIRYLVPENVESIIEGHRLYRPIS